MNLFSGEMLPLVLALISGVLMAVQGSLNALLSKAVGLLEATFVVQLTGAILVMILLFVFNLGKGNLYAWQAAPWYSWLGGIIGVGIIYLVAASIPSVGVANATTAIIVGQVLTAIIIDHFGGFGLERSACSPQQLLGLVLLAVGAKLLLK
ncbi:DMT family transporter [Sporomusa termitida]|uniref:Inner membrane exporter, YdcZ n=1 Tax=Sporomusa termitida TaxID=2377 RepID=A0A517DUB5_9FIRM|nr:DMT family transporter [Sporomusa termitida]QDR80898.1 Putative inner membrane exporter, YdcZ [Sporomusa termitida]